jgi:hypothetical protein
VGEMSEFHRSRLSPHRHSRMRLAGIHLCLIHPPRTNLDARLRGHDKLSFRLSEALQPYQNKHQFGWTP